MEKGIFKASEMNKYTWKNQNVKLLETTTGWTPIEVFKLFMDEEVITHILNSSVEYAQQKR